MDRSETQFVMPQHFQLQPPDVEEVVVDPRVAPLLPGRQVARVLGLSVHLAHKPRRCKKYLDLSDYVVL